MILTEPSKEFKAVESPMEVEFLTLTDLCYYNVVTDNTVKHYKKIHRLWKHTAKNSVNNQRLRLLHTNFKTISEHLQGGRSLRLIRASLYSTLLIVDPEEELYPLNQAGFGFRGLVSFSDHEVSRLPWRKHQTQLEALDRWRQFSCAERAVRWTGRDLRCSRCGAWLGRARV